LGDGWRSKLSLILAVDGQSQHSIPEFDCVTPFLVDADGTSEVVECIVSVMAMAVVRPSDERATGTFQTHKLRRWQFEPASQVGDRDVRLRRCTPVLSNRGVRLLWLH
jgi:hypothetical protein